MSRVRSLESALLRMIDLFAFSSHSNAARRRYETATGVLLPRSGIETLDILARGPRPANDLAVALRTDPTQSSRRVASLVRQGFLAKNRGTDDRRQVVLALTDAGERLVHRWQTSWLTELRRPLDTWAAEDVETLTEWLRSACTRLTPMMAAHVDTDLVSPGRTEVFALPATSRREVTECLAVIADIVYLVGRTDFEETLRSVEVDLTAPQYFVLSDIHTLGPTTVSALAGRLDLEQSAASRAVSALHQQALIDRTPDGADGRSRQLTVTETGARLLDFAHRNRLEDLHGLFADIDSHIAKRLAQLTDRYLDDLLETADVAAGRYLESRP